MKCICLKTYALTYIKEIIVWLIKIEKDNFSVWVFLICKPQVSVRAVGEWVFNLCLCICVNVFPSSWTSYAHLHNFFIIKCEKERKSILWVDYFWVVFSLVWRPWTFSWLPSREFLLHRLIFFLWLWGFSERLSWKKEMSGGKLQFGVFLFLSLGAKNFLQSFQGFSLIHIYYYGCLFGMRWKSIKYIHKERQNIWRWRKMKSETSED